MKTRRSLGRPIVGRPRRSSVVGAEIDNKVVVQPGYLDGTDDNDFIPNVPQIPDRFRSRGEAIYHPAPGRNNVKEPEQVPVDLSSIPGPHTRFLPNCSMGKPKTTQVVSNAMMTAYNAMRGNSIGMQQADDPLFKWIQEREDLAEISTPKIHETKDITIMLGNIDEALGSQAIVDTPQSSTFEMYRPAINHIKPPQDMDMTPYAFAARCAELKCDDSDDSDDSDDDEKSTRLSGRISPCTFLEWSKGCVPWNGLDKAIKPDTSGYQRMRPPTPAVPEPPKPRARPFDTECVAQWDIHTGEEISPTYRVPTSPSIIYTPPGIDFEGYKSDNFHDKFRRMAPHQTREMLRMTYGDAKSLPKLSENEDPSFSYSEVNRATVIVPEFHQRQGYEVDVFVRDGWGRIRNTENMEMLLYQHTQNQDKQIKELQREWHRMTQALSAIRQQRDECEKKKLEEKRRMEKIRGYVAEQTRDVQGRLEGAWNRLNRTQAQARRNYVYILSLQEKIGELCEQAGVKTPQEAYDYLLRNGDDEAGGGDGNGRVRDVYGQGGEGEGCDNAKAVPGEEEVGSGGYQGATGDYHAGNGGHQPVHGDYHVGNGGHQTVHGDYQAANGGHEVATGQDEAVNDGYRAGNGGHQAVSEHEAGSGQEAGSGHEAGNGPYQVVNGGYQIGNGEHEGYEEALEIGPDEIGSAAICGQISYPPGFYPPGFENFGYQNQDNDNNNIGPWSPSDLERAGQRFDQAAVGLEMQPAAIDRSNDALHDKRRDGSSDSGVSVGHRALPRPYVEDLDEAGCF
ncbi:hypothetical protein GGR50DRAFT_696292 [Xylaria sp. CBS 124048]|nr:hypothetical protein GGR50DRAFT_696292 [Xylaria sp. CBS 124048]